METIDDNSEEQYDLKRLMRIAIAGIFVYLTITSASSLALQFASDALTAEKIRPETAFKSSYVIQLVVFVLLAFLLADWMKKFVLKNDALKKLMMLSILYYVIVQILLFIYTTLMQDLFYTDRTMQGYYDYFLFLQNSNILVTYVNVVNVILQLVILSLFLVRKPKIILKSKEIEN